MEVGPWIKLVEYGDYTHPEGTQHVTYKAAVEMQRKFRSLCSRLARKFGGIPIYIGHPDDQQFAHQPGHTDTRSYAWVQDLEARSDGLWILPKWSAIGKDILRNAFFKFLSPRWEMKREGSYLIPIRLVSVGLTNNPNIPGEAIANQTLTLPCKADISEEVIFNKADENDKHKYDAVSGKAEHFKNDRNFRNEDTEDQQVKRQGELTLSDLVQRYLGFDTTQPLEDLEKAFIQYLEKVKQQQQGLTEKITELDKLQQQYETLSRDSERFYKTACEQEECIKQLTEQLMDQKVLSGEHFIKFALTRGLIAPGESDTWKERYLMDPVTTSNELLNPTSTAKNVLNTSSVTEHLSRNESANVRRRILGLVQERMEQWGEAYTDAWKSVRQQYPALF